MFKWLISQHNHDKGQASTQSQNHNSIKRASWNSPLSEPTAGHTGFMSTLVQQSIHNIANHMTDQMENKQMTPEETVLTQNEMVKLLDGLQQRTSQNTMNPDTTPLIAAKEQLEHNQDQKHISKRQDTDFAEFLQNTHHKADIPPEYKATSIPTIEYPPNQTPSPLSLSPIDESTADPNMDNYSTLRQHSLITAIPSDSLANSTKYNLPSLWNREKQQHAIDNKFVDDVASINNFSSTNATSVDYSDQFSFLSNDLIVKENGDIIYFQLHYNIIHVAIAFIIFAAICILVIFRCRKQKVGSTHSNVTHSLSDSSEMRMLVARLYDTYDGEDKIISRDSDSIITMAEVGQSIANYKKSINRFLSKGSSVMPRV